MKKCGFLFALLFLTLLCGCERTAKESKLVLPETGAVSAPQETQALDQTEAVAPVLPVTAPVETIPPTTIVPTEAVTDIYSVVDEYVYAITDVNIRTGPGTEYMVLDYLPKGNEINRIGIGADGWSQVYYKGDGAYIRSKYLTYEKPEAKPEPVVTEKIPQKTDSPAPPAEEDSESVEDFVDPAPIVPQAPVGPSTVAPQEPMVQPTEAPYVEPERIDTSALTAHGNSFAASLGFTIDYGVRDGYFPPDTIRFSSMSAACSNVEDNVLVLYNNIIARDGSIDGYRCCVTVSDNGNGTYTTTVYYG